MQMLDDASSESGISMGSSRGSPSQVSVQLAHFILPSFKKYTKSNG
jgi:hypothetical protein